jgi:hypothetical protein
MHPAQAYNHVLQRQRQKKLQLEKCVFLQSNIYIHCKVNKSNLYNAVVHWVIAGLAQCYDRYIGPANNIHVKLECR